MAERLGVATAAEIRLDTLEDQLRAEALDGDRCLVLPTPIAARSWMPVRRTGGRCSPSGPPPNVTSQKEINIVTVRNRVGAGDMRPSTLINAVHGAYPAFTVFHCSFCRSSMYADAGLGHKATMSAEHFF